MQTKHTAENTEASAVKVTRKRTAKRLGEFYIYRGWLVKKWDNNYLNDPDIRGVQWNTYRNLAAYHAGGTIDIARTLRDAKMYIDICINRDAS
jgi:hypothetical protein